MEHSEQVLSLIKEYVGQHRPDGSLIGVAYLAFPEQLIEIVSSHIQTIGEKSIHHRYLLGLPAYPVHNYIFTV